MKISIKSALVGLVLLAAPACAQPAPPPPEAPKLVLVRVERFAVLADLSTVTPDGDGVRMRSFQVAPEGFRAADNAYWGGWSWWRFDCVARTADRLDFVSVRERGAEGPATPDAAPAAAVGASGDAAALLTVACDPASVGEADADSLEEAVRVGRTALTAQRR